MKRRKFVRTVIMGGAGAAAVGLPFERAYSQAPTRQAAVRTNRRHIVRGPAHLLRDGHEFQLPSPTEYKDVVIVGAGPVGLTAAVDLALHGVQVVLIDGRSDLSDGSRAICWAKRSLEI